jgi:hypothetical protein
MIPFNLTKTFFFMASISDQEYFAQRAAKIRLAEPRRLCGRQLFHTCTRGGAYSRQTCGGQSQVVDYVHLGSKTSRKSLLSSKVAI